MKTINATSNGKIAKITSYILNNFEMEGKDISVNTANEIANNCVDRNFSGNKVITNYVVSSYGFCRITKSEIEAAKEIKEIASYIQSHFENVNETRVSDSEALEIAKSCDKYKWTRRDQLRQADLCPKGLIEKK